MCALESLLYHSSIIVVSIEYHSENSGCFSLALAVPEPKRCCCIACAMRVPSLRYLSKCYEHAILARMPCACALAWSPKRFCSLEVRIGFVGVGFSFSMAKRSMYIYNGAYPLFDRGFCCCYLIRGSRAGTPQRKTSIGAVQSGYQPRGK